MPDTITLARANDALDHYGALVESALAELPPDAPVAEALAAGLDALAAVVHEANRAHAAGLAERLGDQFVTDEEVGP